MPHATSLAPCLRLPIELIIIILLFLKWELIYQWEETSRQDWYRKPLQWLPAAQFCQLWRDAAVKHSAQLWNTVDIKPPFITPAQLLDSLQRTKGAPLDLSFPNYSYSIPSNLIGVLAPAAQRLVSLNVPSLAGLSSFFLAPLPALKTLRVLDGKDSSLIAAAPFPNLKVLDLRWTMPLPDISQLFSLTTLTVSNLVLPPNVSFAQFAHILSLLPCFESLTVYDLLPSIQPYTGTKAERPALKALNRLTLFDYSSTNVGIFLTWFTIPFPLKRLVLGSHDWVGLQEGVDIATMLQQLIPLDADERHVGLINTANHLNLNLLSEEHLMCIITIWHEVSPWMTEPAGPPTEVVQLALDFEDR